MLVLTRKLGEVIEISGGIKLQVLEIRHGQVKVGFTAPREIRIHRTEVAERIRQGITQEEHRAGRRAGDGS